ncbi:MAG: hypothetical protein HY775_04445 [Acidobacteria bacterium]|nr:hypothetical protein [Acidobacteriota bacterium]
MSPTRTPVRRRWRRALLVLVVVQALVGGLALGYRWFTTSTEVSTEDALARFRSETAGGGSSSPALASPTGSAGAEATPTGAAPTDGTPTGATPTGTLVSPGPQPTVDASPSNPAMESRPPDEGVYRFATQGTEQVDRLPPRDLPPKSQRVVTGTGDGRTWTNHHLFSDQHEEWFDLTIAPDGVFCPSFRARITFGPFTEDETLRFDPPLRFSTFPFRLGEQWQGTFSGETSGSYTGKTFEHTSMTIGGETLEAWAVQIDMTFEGKVSGEARFRLWLSPKYRLSLKEQYREVERTSGHTYRNDITITLLSTKPQQ